jgi:hypothetical protein
MAWLDAEDNDVVEEDDAAADEADDDDDDDALPPSGGDSFPKAARRAPTVCPKSWTTFRDRSSAALPRLTTSAVTLTPT